MTSIVAPSARPAPAPWWSGPLVAAQLFLVTFSIGAVSLLYLAGLAKAGDHATLVGTPVDPKDVVPFGLHLWNPLAWLYQVMVLVVAVGWIFAGPAAVAGAVLLGRASVRARPGRWVPLLLGTVGCAVFVFLVFSPLTAELRRWLAD